MCLYVLSTVLCCLLRFPHINDVRLFPSSCLIEVSCLINAIWVYLLKWCPTDIVVCFPLFFFVLLVSLDCPFLIAPSVFSNIYLNSDGIKSINIKQSEHSPLILTKLTEHKEKTTILAWERNKHVPEITG